MSDGINRGGWKQDYGECDMSANEPQLLSNSAIKEALKEHFQDTVSAPVPDRLRLLLAALESREQTMHPKTTREERAAAEGRNNGR